MRLSFFFLHYRNTCLILFAYAFYTEHIDCVPVSFLIGELMMDQINAPAENMSFFDHVKYWLSPDVWAEKLNISRSELFDFGLYLGVGFLVGFLATKYSKILISFVAFALLLFVLQQMNVIMVVINWQRVNELFGIQQSVLPEGNTDMIVFYIDWARTHLGLVISFLVGFIIGIKLG